MALLTLVNVATWQNARCPGTARSGDEWAHFPGFAIVGQRKHALRRRVQLEKQPRLPVRGIDRPGDARPGLARHPCVQRPRRRQPGGCDACRFRAAGQSGSPARTRLAGRPLLKDRLSACSDHGFSLTPLWTIALAAGLPVSPTIDRTTQTLYFVYKDDKRLFQHSFLSGARLEGLRYPGCRQVARSVRAQRTPGVVAGRADVHTAVVGIGRIDPGQQRPICARIHAERHAVVAALGQADQHSPRRLHGRMEPGAGPPAGRDCPIVVGTNSGISRLCDFAP